MTLVLNGVLAFFWRVLSPQNRGHSQVPGIFIYAQVLVRMRQPESSGLLNPVQDPWRQQYNKTSLCWGHVRWHFYAGNPNESKLIHITGCFVKRVYPPPRPRNIKDLKFKVKPKNWPIENRKHHLPNFQFLSSMSVFTGVYLPDFFPEKKYYTTDFHSDLCHPSHAMKPQGLKMSNKIPKKETNWLVLSDEQMSKRWPFSLLNDEQMSNKVGVKHQPAKRQRFVLSCP